MRYSNSDIVPAANRGIDAANSTESFSTVHHRPEFTRYGAPYYGHLPQRIRDILDAAFRAGRVDQVVYSYNTPIAFRVDGVWVQPVVSYSMTTSCKHQSQLWELSGSTVRIPWDCGIDEFERYLSRHIVFDGRRTVRGPMGDIEADVL